MNIPPQNVPRSKGKSFAGRLAKYSKSCGWVLCVGAGTSRGVFPDWNELARLIARGVIPGVTGEAIDEVLALFGPEAMMQAAQNYTAAAGTPATPADALSAVLYGRITQLAGADWPIAAKALTSSRPSNLQRREWHAFRALVQQGGPSSASLIAEQIAAVADTPKRPDAIISFNAEPLLYALINCEYGLTHPEALKAGGKKILDRLSHDLASRTQGRIPYYYAHGLLPVPDGRKRFNSSIATDRLVFSESQYLRLSRSAYSWQSATFLSSCIHHRCVFIGLSFCDANLRRWLAWEYEGRTELRQKKGLPTNRPSHLWIRKRPDGGAAVRQQKMELIEMSVQHLGVRLVWIEDWSNVGTRLALMLQDEGAEEFDTDL